MKLIKKPSLISNPSQPVSILFFYCILSTCCAVHPATFTPAVHHLSRLLGDIYNEVIFTGHPLLLFTNPLGQNGHLSVNELPLSYFSLFSFQSTLRRWRRTLTPAPLHLSREDTQTSAILPGVTEYCTLSATWNMTSRFPCFLLSFVLFSFST